MSVPNARLCLAPAVAAAVLLALTGCQKQAPDAAAAVDPGFSLDEGQLLRPIRFAATDIDPAISACVDLGARTNGKWLAANPIPGDQTRWGAFNVLAERSLQVQQQLATQVALKTSPTGIEKIVADFWATGMDEAKLDADGAVAAHIRTVAARGENPLFSFGPEADFNDSSMSMGYALQGGTSLP
ncbi:MAG TPA: hypothetical protein VMK82_10440, partial [Steroidobacteraceae bacterium]|nr:hypothetical protein [Steroidobacteraceae bacterium]